MSGRALLSLALLATVLAHGGISGGEFVYDDHRFITLNPAIRSVDPVAFVLDAETASNPDGVTADIYRPARTLLFSLEWALFGAEPRGWHAVSLLLHLLGVVLVYRLLRGLLPEAAWVAALAAGLFGVHPMTSESVAWISSQGDLLALDLMLAALIVLERRGFWRTCAGTGIFALACLAKESALILPAWLLLRDFALSRTQAQRLTAGPWARCTLGRVALMALVIIGYLVLRLSVVPGLAQVDPPEGGRAASARGMLAGLVFYARGLVDPRPFTFDLRFDIPLTWSEPSVVLGLGLLMSLLAAASYGLARGRGLLVLATLGLLAALIPVSNVLVPLKTFVADRFFHPALVCVVLGLAWALVALTGTRRLLLSAAVLCLGVAFGIGSARNAAAWKTDLTLWTAVRNDRPDNATAYYGIARAQREARHLSAAERGYRTYLEFNPLDGKAAYELGDLFDEVAGSLYIDRSPLRQQTDIELRRRQARVAQIESYRHAAQVWERVGLAAGRGSPALREAMLQSWVNAAVDLPDLREAQVALDQLLLAMSLDPRDAQQVLDGAPWHHRRMRWVLAWMGDQTPRVDLDAQSRLAVLRLRAQLLRDVGLDPGAGDQAQMQQFERGFKGLIDEREQQGGAAEAGLFVYYAQSVAAQGRPADARAILERGLGQHPRSALLREWHAGLSASERGD